MDRLLLRPVEAAETLGVSRSRIYELIAQGELPSIRIGGSVRVPVDALRDWIDVQLGAGDELPVSPPPTPAPKARKPSRHAAAV
jgi:excisionase family DNA binding protein